MHDLILASEGGYQEFTLTGTEFAWLSSRPQRLSSRSEWVSF